MPDPVRGNDHPACLHRKDFLSKSPMRFPVVLWISIDQSPDRRMILGRRLGGQIYSGFGTKIRRAQQASGRPLQVVHCLVKSYIKVSPRNLLQISNMSTKPHHNGVDASRDRWA